MLFGKLFHRAPIWATLVKGKRGRLLNILSLVNKSEPRIVLGWGTTKITGPDNGTIMNNRLTKIGRGARLPARGGHGGTTTGTAAGRRRAADAPATGARGVPTAPTEAPTVTRVAVTRLTLHVAVSGVKTLGVPVIKLGLTVQQLVPGRVVRIHKITPELKIPLNKSHKRETGSVKLGQLCIIKAHLRTPGNVIVIIHQVETARLINGIVLDRSKIHLKRLAFKTGNKILGNALTLTLTNPNLREVVLINSRSRLGLTVRGIPVQVARIKGLNRSIRAVRTRISALGLLVIRINLGIIKDLTNRRAMAMQGHQPTPKILRRTLPLTLETIWPTETKLAKS